MTLGSQLIASNLGRLRDVWRQGRFGDLRVLQGGCDVCWHWTRCRLPDDVARLLEGFGPFCPAVAPGSVPTTPRGMKSSNDQRTDHSPALLA